ncbi:MAG: hypothetical protein PSX37_04905, partial [bacterium]|nr:hypothetical protein [bacterium]
SSPSQPSSCGCGKCPQLLAVLAVALFMVPRTSSFAMLLVVIGAVAASAGILLPIVTYWISTKAGNAQGAELGKQTAAASLGSAVGSAAGGVLFAMPFAGASFLLTAVVTAGSMAIALGLPHLLVTRRRGARSPPYKRHPERRGSADKG